MFVVWQRSTRGGQWVAAMDHCLTAWCCVCYRFAYVCVEHHVSWMRKVVTSPFVECRGRVGRRKASVSTKVFVRISVKRWAFYTCPQSISTYCDCSCVLYSLISSDSTRMTENERDQIDQDAQIFMRTCSEAIRQLRNEGACLFFAGLTVQYVNPFRENILILIVLSCFDF